jgi:hypothetical protein
LIITVLSPLTALIITTCLQLVAVVRQPELSAIKIRFDLATHQQLTQRPLDHLLSLTAITESSDVHDALLVKPLAQLFQTAYFRRLNPLPILLLVVNESSPPAVRFIARPRLLVQLLEDLHPDSLLGTFDPL